MGSTGAAVVDMKLIFVQSQDLIHGQNRMDWVAGIAMLDKDRLGIQSFLDPFVSYCGEPSGQFFTIEAATEIPPQSMLNSQCPA
jgi:hypothetical protein